MGNLYSSILDIYLEASEIADIKEANRVFRERVASEFNIDISFDSTGQIDLSIDEQIINNYDEDFLKKIIELSKKLNPSFPAVNNKPIDEHSLKLKLFERIINSSNEIILRVKKDGKPVLANTAFFDYFRIEQDVFYNSNFWTLELKDFNIRVEELVKNLINNTKIVESEISLFSEETDWFLLKTELVSCDDNNEEYQITAININRIKQAEKKAQFREFRFKQLLEDVKLLSILLDKDGNVIFCNDYVVQILECKSRSEVVGYNWFDKFLPEYAAIIVRERFSKAVKHKRYAEETYINDIKTISGKIKNVSWSNTFLFNEKGEIEGTASIGQDISKDNNEFSESKHNAEWLKVLYEDLPVGLLVVSMVDNTIKMVNKYAANYLGADIDELVGDDFSNYNFDVFDESENLLEGREAPLQKMLTHNEKVFNRILGVKLQDNDEIHWHLFNSEILTDPLDDDKKEAVFTFQDITRIQNLNKGNESNTHFLKKRVREINCLYQVHKILKRDYKHIDKSLQLVAEILPEAFQYPEITCARLTYKSRRFLSNGFQESPWFIKTDLTVEGTVCGALEIFYKEERKILDEGPFLKGERALVESLAVSLGHFFDQYYAYSKVKRDEANFRLIIETSPNAIFKIRNDGNVNFLNVKAKKLIGYDETKNGDGFNFFDLIDEHYKPRFLDDLRRAFNSDDKDAGEFVIVTLNKKQIPVELKISVLKDHKGKLSEYVLFVQDLSKKKKTEEELERNKLRLEEALDASTDGIWEWHVPTGEAFFSPRYYTMLGYEPYEIPASIESWEKLLHPDDAERVKKKLQTAFHEGHKVFTNEFRLRTKEGNYRWILGRGKVTRYDDNHFPERVVGTHQDITQRRLAEEEIRKSENKFKAIFNQTFQFIILMDINGFIISLNDTSIDLLNQSREELIGRRLTNLSFITNKYFDEFMLHEAFSAAVRGELSRYETQFIDTNDNVKHLDISIKPIRNSQNEIFYIILEGRDVTEEKSTREALLNSEDGLNEAQKIAKLGSWQFDLVNNKFTASDALFSIIEVDKKSFEPSYQNLMSFVHPDDMAKLNDQNFKQNWIKISQDFELRLLLKNNKIKHVRWIGKLKRTEGKITSVFGTLQDISDRKKIEFELIKARNEAQKSDRLKTEFLAQMSHEIRTPINIMLSGASLVEDLTREVAEEEISILFNGMRKAGKRIIRTIDLILNMSEIQAGSYKKIIKRIDLSKEVLNNLYIEFVNQAKDKGLELQISVNTPNTVIFGDDYTINQIFANLIDNAIKYTPAGKIEITLSEYEDKILVEVIDTGIGMSQEYLSTLFVPFTQEEQGYTRKYEGNGLGLALVKKYCEINDAQISVKSEKGKGSRFIVAFTKKHP